MRICLRRREFIAGLGSAASVAVLAAAGNTGAVVRASLRRGYRGTGPIAPSEKAPTNSTATSRRVQLNSQILERLR
jgi:hypothetical protein